jgi:hypothetical protein
MSKYSSISALGRSGRSQGKAIVPSAGDRLTLASGLGLMDEFLRDGIAKPRHMGQLGGLGLG